MITTEISRQPIAPTDDGSTLPQVDPTTTEIVRQSLCSAANQMKRSLMRTAFSPTVYDALDFAVALYDRNVCMLAQSPTIPAFMGTLSFCVEAAIEGVGGADALEPGDILLYNVPYGSGSHAQDLAVVAPVFLPGGELVGYAVSKAHQFDIGAKNTYCTDTTDVFQEGVLFPGVKLYRAGQLVKDIYRIALANSRSPRAMRGDLHAQEVCVRVGHDALVRIISRFGLPTFRRAVETMYAQSERAIRGFFEAIPNGRYVGRSSLDNDGVTSERIEIEVAVEVAGSTLTVDFRGCPDSRPGPVNCPYPSTVSASRVAVMMLAGGGAEPNEGHFRPLNVLTRPGSMFQPESPAPCYLYGWATMQAIEAIFLAFAEQLPDRVPGESGADIASVGIVTRDKRSGELIEFGPALPVGHGGRPQGDGSVLFVAGLSNSRGPSIELAEAKFPLRYHRWEFVPDSFGPGQYRGAPAWQHDWELLQDGALISTIDRTLEAPRGVHGGEAALPNRFVLRSPDGTSEALSRATDQPLAKGSVIEVRCGGGGGYGPPKQRDASAIRADLDDGLMTEAFAKAHFPQAFS